MTPERLQRLEELFHAARELAPDARDAFLAVECRGDAALRQDVVSLLAQQDGTLLQQGVAGAAALVLSPAHGSRQGRSVGQYVLGSLLGVGGMGEVYRARDGKLDRDVAMKLLPDSVARHPDRLARFQREARILASLNHPNIGAIYGLEESDDLRGLVLELVDGPTLKERLDTGALPVEESLVIARQIAEALEAAHQKGVIHRDLKPANVKITPGGMVKVLDFGLAKVDVPEATGPAGLPALATTEGVVLGTVAYMSPEQARGRPVDKRTDIWAFGCVLFEMLAGTRPFPGESAADVLGAITGANPDWTLLPRGTPPRVRQLLQRCLSKDPARRLHDVADARIEIEDAIGGADDGVNSGEGIRPSRAPLPWILAVTATIAAAVAGWMAWSVPQPPQRTPERVAIPLPDNLALFGIGRGSSVTISPDGQRIAYVGLAQGRRQLYLRPIDASASTLLAGTTGASSPFFSPDGQWVAFLDNVPSGGLKKVSIDGRGPFPIVDSMGDGLEGFAVTGGWWGADDSIVFASENPKKNGLFRVSGNGGTPERVTTKDEADGAGNHAWPQVLPGGRAVVYTVWNLRGFEASRIVLRRLAGGEPVVLVEGASYGRVVTGAGGAWLVYVKEDALLAAAFDLDRLAIAGPEVRVIDGVFTNLSGGAHFSVSTAGRLAYVPGRLVEREKTLQWVGRDGSTMDIMTLDGVTSQHRVSPDGRQLVAIRSTSAGRDVWAIDLTGGGRHSRVTLGGLHSSPIWAGRRVIYTSGADAGMFWKIPDAAAPEERLTTSTFLQIPGSVSADGSLLAYSQDHPEIGRDIWLLPLSDPAKARLFVGTKAGELGPTFSPDGKWLAYQSNLSGGWEIYLASLADARQFPVSKGGGTSALWSPDGRELFYRAGPSMMSVPIAFTRGEPRIGVPRVLFSGLSFQGGDIAPDGRFFFLKATPLEASSRFIELVSNWFEELQARVPVQ